MNKQEKLKFLESLKQNPRITDVWYAKSILEHGHEDSIWYDSDVLSLLIDDRYRYFCTAYGDIRLTWVPTGDDVVSEGHSADRIREFLLSHGLTTDAKIRKAEDKGDLYFGNNNWFEDTIFDTETEQWLDMSGLDISEGPFAFDLDYISECIKTYSR